MGHVRLEGLGQLRAELDVDRCRRRLGIVTVGGILRCLSALSQGLGGGRRGFALGGHQSLGALRRLFRSL